MHTYMHAYMCMLLRGPPDRPTCTYMLTAECKTWQGAVGYHPPESPTAAPMVTGGEDRLLASVDSRPDRILRSLFPPFGSTTIRLRTFRLRHFVYRHFVYRYFVYYCTPGYRTVIHPTSVSAYC